MDEAILNYSLNKGGEKLCEWYREQRVRTKLQIKRRVELAKIALSTKKEVVLELPGAPVPELTLTPGDLAFALQPITTRMVAKVTQTVVEAVSKIDNISYVVLSGGTSLNQVVQNSILAMFQHIPRDRFVVPDPSKAEDVQTCLCAVATGLALLHSEGSEPIEVFPALANAT